ncbi:glycosyltransferase family 1 protein [Stutzerimonas sp. FeSN7]|uniref:glycosyltransferase family 4 protein n=1 Tax=Stutzerimonas sp. FeSN7 TaxID=3035479 RepID=UPI0025544186|nr:glycosyltransferase family 1 protein [Stutzerimonas sp. FeSN7]MDL2172710.1 glycosyltransferase family 1 protein [Stutzerimonas sp. FeSN7]
MKLLINTESLLPPITGIGTYTQNLLEQFVAMQALETIECFSGHHFTSATQALQQCGDSIERAAPLASSRGHLVQFLRNSSLAYRARETLRNSLLRLKSARLRNFVYHEPNFILRTHKGPCVATIHDLSFIHYPHYHPPKRVAWLTRELPRTLARADSLITDSEHIRRELIEHFCVREERVRAIHLGAASCFAPRTAEQTAQVLDKHQLCHGQYLLFVGTLEPRKGIDTLLRAWSSLPDSLTQAFPLVVAGAPGWGNDTTLATIAKLKQSRGLRHLNFVSSADLPELYAGARAFVYPSHYEGFGLPILEAMSSGVPVICTHGTSMCEITGDTALLVERGSVEHLVTQLQWLLEDDSACEYFAVSGLKRAKRFSWARCASETLSVYRHISA